MRRSLDVLGAENPVHARLFVQSMSALTILFEIGDEAVAIASKDEEIVLSSFHARADVRVRTTLPMALALVRGETSVLDAVRGGAVDVFGKAGAFARASRALEVFVHGLVRCPSGGAVVDDLVLAIHEQKAEAT